MYTHYSLKKTIIYVNSPINHIQNFLKNHHLIQIHHNYKFPNFKNNKIKPK